MKPSLKFAGILAVLALLLTVAWLATPSRVKATAGKTSRAPRSDVARFPALPGRTPGPAAAGSTPGPTGGPGPEPRDNIWRRLAHATVRDSRETVAPDGSTVRLTLITNPGQYENVLVRETLSTNARTGKTFLRQEAMVADHLLVQRRDEISPAEFAQTMQRAGLAIREDLSSPGLAIVSCGPATLDSLQGALAKLSGMPGLSFSEPDYFVFTADVPGESRPVLDANGVPVLAKPNPAPPPQALDNTGGPTGGNSALSQPPPIATFDPIGVSLNVGNSNNSSTVIHIINQGAQQINWLLSQDAIKPTGPAPDPAVTPNDTFYSLEYGMKDPTGNGAGIDATHAWSLSTGNTGVKVAVIDTGVDATHPDLAANIDTANGWNFITNTNNPADDNGHGTHVSGTIAARGNNSIGVAGVTWNCKIVPLKFLNAAGSGTNSAAINAINYAASKGISILSNSWGGGGYSEAMVQAIRNSKALFVAAAGNNASDNDALPSYPASYNCSNILVVAASDNTGTLASFSNYGATSVDLAAPGDTIASIRATNIITCRARRWPHRTSAGRPRCSSATGRRSTSPSSSAS